VIDSSTAVFAVVLRLSSLPRNTSTLRRCWLSGTVTFFGSTWPPATSGSSGW
jgi:hypothetical protein